MDLQAYLKQWQDEILKKEETIKDLPRINQVHTCSLDGLNDLNSNLRITCCILSIHLIEERQVC